MGPLQMSKTPKIWAISCMVLLITLQLVGEPAGATRTLNEDQWAHANYEGLWLQALPRSPSPPSGRPSPCTSIPGGNKGGKCTLRLKEMNVAGPRLAHAHRRFGFPNNVIKMSVASLAPDQNDVVPSRSQ